MLYMNNFAQRFVSEIRRGTPSRKFQNVANRLTMSSDGLCEFAAACFLVKKVINLS